MCFDSSTTVTTPPPTAAELEAQQLTLEQLKRQDQLWATLGPEFQQQLVQSFQDQAKQRQISDRAAQLQAGVAGTPLSDPVLEAQANQAYQQFQQQQHGNDVQQQLQDLQLAAIKNGGKATPEQAALIDQATTAAQAGGESDISRFLQQTVRQINDETAASAGLRPTDTPVVRLSERAGEEAARQQGQLTLGLQGANANAKLNYPLAAQQVQTAASGATSSLGLAAQQFQAQLAQQAADNRLRLQQTPISNSMGFATGINPIQFSNSLAQDRWHNATTTSSPSLWSSLTGQGQQYGGGGALGAIGSFLIGSDRRLKTSIVRIGTHPLGIGIYKYLIRGKRDIGVMADEVLKVLPQAVRRMDDGYLAVDYSMLV